MNLNRLLGVVIFSLLLCSFSLATASAQSDFEPYTDLSSCDTGTEKPLLLGGAKPSSQILDAVDMLSQPPLSSNTHPLTIATLPKDLWVIVFDLDDQTRDWFRILVPCGDFALSGWIPSASVNYSKRRANIYAAPPGCAIPLDTIDSLDDTWKSPVSGRVAVVFDVFRVEPDGKRYPDSFLYPTRNGRELRDKERKIATTGAFLLSGSVINAEVQSGNKLGFSVISSSKDELRMFGIMYQVPEGCEFAER